MLLNGVIQGGIKMFWLLEQVSLDMGSSLAQYLSNNVKVFMA